MTVQDLPTRILESLMYDGPATIEQLCDRLQRHPVDIRSALAKIADDDENAIIVVANEYRRGA